MLAVVFAVACALLTGIAQAEQAELRIAKQYGLGYLQMMVMEDQNMVEKAAAAAGLPDIKVTWATFRSSDVMNDALVSGNVDFVVKVSMQTILLQMAAAQTFGESNYTKLDGLTVSMAHPDASRTC